MNNTSKNLVFIDHEALKRATCAEAHQQTIMDMVDYFTTIINEPDRGTGFPQWSESTRKLMELSWRIYRTRCLHDTATGRALTMRRIAELLCKKLHHAMPAHPYQAAWASRHGKYATLVNSMVSLRANGCSFCSMLYWARQIQFPRFESYRGVFD